MAAPLLALYAHRLKGKENVPDMQAVARSSLAGAASFAPVASSSSSISHRSFSTSVLRPARSTAYRPKRIPTYYGQHAAAHPQPDPAQRPTREETDTSNHPLWRFFHDQQSLEVPDKRKDNSSVFSTTEIIPSSPPDQSRVADQARACTRSELDRARTAAQVVHRAAPAVVHPPEGAQRPPHPA